MGEVPLLADTMVFLEELDPSFYPQACDKRMLRSPSDPRPNTSSSAAAREAGGETRDKGGGAEKTGVAARKSVAAYAE